jgi:hypothetical protein
VGVEVVVEVVVVVVGVVEVVVVEAVAVEVVVGVWGGGVSARVWRGLQMPHCW